MSRRILFVPALALLVLAACEQPVEQADAPAATPTEPTMTLAPDPTASFQGAKLPPGQSSVCRGYAAKRAGVQTAISKSPVNAPGLAALKARSAALDAIITDACQ